MLERTINLCFRDEETVGEELSGGGGHISSWGRLTFLSELLVPSFMFFQLHGVAGPDGRAEAI